MNNRVMSALAAALNTPAVLQALNEALGDALEDARLGHLNDGDDTVNGAGPLSVVRFRDAGHERAVEVVLTGRLT